MRAKITPAGNTWMAFEATIIGFNTDEETGIEEVIIEKDDGTIEAYGPLEVEPLKG